MSDLVQFVHEQKGMFLERCSDEKVTFQNESQFAIQAIQANDYLSKIAASNLQSFQNAIINVAAIGISLNPANKHAYLVPRDGKVCLDISYMGLLHLAMSTGSIRWGQCKLVHENDDYESNGLDKAPTHKYNAFKGRGDVIGGYCTVKTSDGDYLTEEMTTDEINNIRDRSQGFKSGKRSPWLTDWSEMARKTIVKRASKYWPKVDRLDTAIHHLNTDSGEGVQSDVIDVSPSTKEQEQVIINALDKAGRTQDKLIDWCVRVFKRDISNISDLTFDEADRVIKKIGDL